MVEDAGHLCRTITYPLNDQRARHLASDFKAPASGPMRWIAQDVSRAHLMALNVSDGPLADLFRNIPFAIPPAGLSD
jgi:hypothetical protein